MPLASRCPTTLASGLPGRLESARRRLPHSCGSLTVRYWIKAFLAGSFAALTDKPHTGRKPGITPEIRAVVREWLTKADRTWNARQVASEVHTRYGVVRSVAQWQRVLRRQQMRYKRTRRTLHHKQNVEQVAVRRAERDVLKRGQTADNWTCVTSTKQVLH